MSKEKDHGADLTIRDAEYKNRSAFNENIDNQYGDLLKRHLNVTLKNSSSIEVTPNKKWHSQRDLNPAFSG